MSKQVSGKMVNLQDLIPALGAMRDQDVRVRLRIERRVRVENDEDDTTDDTDDTDDDHSGPG